ncbi:hypothetical protein GTY65_03685 [Streptomyces sp. SID8379]|uniref:hypothetical protein n=1 Tax=unclassified Streptomyces TaxID=2593676 RepID=UPI00039B6101|nr:MULTISPECIES: hypothetical protein [unclassified Streptomyces]MYW63187.1 hypothetical protein [Streptomyces sp. SID8379]
MRTAAGSGLGGVAGAAALAALLTVAGCGNPDTRPSGPESSSSSQVPSLTWEFEHIADFSGDLTDVALLAENDIWAVGTENDGDPAARLLHYDGARWTPEPLPGSLGTVEFPPALDEIGDGKIWLRTTPSLQGSTTTRWAQWDGTRWAAVPNPPPGAVTGLEADGPDDVWALTGERTAQHWNGSRWTTTSLPYKTADLAVVGPDDAWAVGRRSTGPGTELTGGTPYDQPATMHWDGTSWKAVDTPVTRFDDPIPPEPGAALTKVFALDSGEVRAYGVNGFNHGEGEEEPDEEYIRLRRDGSAWVAQEPAPGGCALRLPVAQDDAGLFLDGNWYLTDDGRCVKIQRHRLPLSTGARKPSNQSLWLSEVHRIPGTDSWLGAGHVQVNQSGDAFDAPVVVRLKRAG